MEYDHVLGTFYQNATLISRPHITERTRLHQLAELRRANRGSYRPQSPYTWAYLHLLGDHYLLIRRGPHHLSETHQLDGVDFFYRIFKWGSSEPAIYILELLYAKFVRQ